MASKKVVLRVLKLVEPLVEKLVDSKVEVLVVRLAVI